MQCEEQKQILAERGDFGGVVVVVIEERTGRLALVYEETMPPPIYWKFPGGGIESSDSDPIEAGRREVFEETGLDIPRENFILLRRNKRQWIYLALARSFRNMRPERGMKVEAFSAGTITSMQKGGTFLPSHSDIMRDVVRFLRTPSALD